jgi:molybdenum cofactor cytidylyltransferase
MSGGTQPNADRQERSVIAAVVLAAGTSSRLGRPKQLLELGGRPLLQHAVDAAVRAGLEEVIVVLGHAADEVVAAVRMPAGAQTVVNPDYAKGQATSLRAGLRELSSDCRAALVLLGDQPSVSSEVVRAVVDAYRGGAGPVVQATYGGRPSHPVLFDRQVWPHLEAVEGDVGARDLLVDHPEWVAAVEVGGLPPPDIDTWEDYRRISGEESAG